MEDIRRKLLKEEIRAIRNKQDGKVNAVDSANAHLAEMELDEMEQEYVWQQMLQQAETIFG